MIIVKLWGGMCNQMFQYAFGYALAKKYNDELRFDIDFYSHQPIKNNTRRKVITKEQFPKLELKVVKRPFLAKILENKYIAHVIRYNTGCNLSIPRLCFMMEKRRKYYPNIHYEVGKINYYDGYWQTERYFEDYKQDILRVFAPTDEVITKVQLWRESLNSDCCVAIHIRRGDFLNAVNQRLIKNGELLNEATYYLKAMKLMQDMLRNPLFCFFSDDMDWCKKTFGLRPNNVYVENQGQDAALVDLFSISLCDHGIISSSTFGWWGNWLRQKDNSIVIAPKGDYTNKYFFNDSWIRI